MNVVLLAVTAGLAWVLVLRLGGRRTKRLQLLATPTSPALSALELRVLRELGGCRGPLACSDWWPPWGYLLGGGAARSHHLFLGAVPWWTHLLAGGSVRVLWSGREPPGLARASVVDCRTLAELLQVRRLLRDRGLGGIRSRHVGFTSSPEREPTLPTPAAGRDPVTVLYLGDADDLAEVLELWSGPGALPPLTLPIQCAPRPPLPEGVTVSDQDLDTLMATAALHLGRTEGDHFDACTDRSRFHGAVSLCPTPEAGIPEQVRDFLARSPEARADLGRQAQEAFRRDHGHFLDHLPCPRPEVYFFTHRGPVVTGGERFDHEMIDELRGRGVQVHSLDPADLSRLAGLRRWCRLPLACALALFLARQTPLLVVDQTYGDWLAPTLLLRRLLGAGRAVLILHHMDGYQSTSTGWFSRWRHRLQVGAADLVVTVSQYCKREILTLGVPEERIRVLGGGHFPERLPPARVRPAPDGPVRLLFVGKCVRRKGLLPLVEALARVPRGSFELHLVGAADSDHCVHELRPRLLELDLQDVVHFEGYVSATRLAEIYARADAFVLPSYQEGYGLVVLEAMGSGLPVLCSRTTALPELVDEGESGLLFTPGDPGDIARVLELVRAAPESLPRMGAVARAKALVQPTWAQRRAQFVAALEPLLA